MTLLMRTRVSLTLMYVCNRVCGFVSTCVHVCVRVRAYVYVRARACVCVPEPHNVSCIRVLHGLGVRVFARARVCIIFGQIAVDLFS